MWSGVTRMRIGTIVRTAITSIAIRGVRSCGDELGNCIKVHDADTYGTAAIDGEGVRCQCNDKGGENKFDDAKDNYPSRDVHSAAFEAEHVYKNDW
jgi:hypothetical protein